MYDRFVSSYDMVRNIRLQEHLPHTIPEYLQQTTTIGMAVHAILVPVHVLVQPFIDSGGLVWQLSENWEIFFLIWGLFDIVASIYYQIAPIWIPISVASLTITTLVFLLSNRFRNPLPEPFHWLVAATAVPSAITIIASTIIGALLVVLGAITLVLIIIGVFLGLLLVGGLFGGFAGSVEADKHRRR